IAVLLVVTLPLLLLVLLLTLLLLVLVLLLLLVTLPLLVLLLTLLLLVAVLLLLLVAVLLLLLPLLVLLVIVPSLTSIRKHFISFVDLLKLFCVFLVGIDIGMNFFGLFTKSLFDLTCASSRCNAENFIVIFAIHIPVLFS